MADPRIPAPSLSGASPPAVSKPTAPATDLVGLAKDINECLGQLAEAHQRSLIYALKLGGLLHEAKAAVAHGNWKTWLATNCKQLSERTAQESFAKMMEEVARRSGKSTVIDGNKKYDTSAPLKVPKALPQPEPVVTDPSGGFKRRF
jgi:hypothetical protein